MSNRLQLYTETKEILYQAYFKDTLHHQYCVACAIGNIVAARMGYTLVPESHWLDKDGRYVSPAWASFCSTSGRYNQSIQLGMLDEPQVRDQITATGYEPHEVAQIEYAFETAYFEGNYQHNEDTMFDGLCRVLDILAKIHGISEEDLTASKQPFQKHHQIKCHGESTSFQSGR